MQIFCPADQRTHKLRELNSQQKPFLFTSSLRSVELTLWRQSQLIRSNVCTYHHSQLGQGVKCQITIWCSEILLCCASQLSAIKSFSGEIDVLFKLGSSLHFDCNLIVKQTEVHGRCGHFSKPSYFQKKVEAKPLDGWAGGCLVERGWGGGLWRGQSWPHGCTWCTQHVWYIPSTGRPFEPKPLKMRSFLVVMMDILERWRTAIVKVLVGWVRD